MDALEKKIDKHGRFVVSTPEEARALDLWVTGDGRCFIGVVMAESKCGGGGVGPQTDCACELERWTSMG